jgi:hypothetical protein
VADVSDLKRRTASCCCGAIKARTIGDPEAVAVCSCEDCQRRTGSAFGISTYWPRSRVILSGEARRYIRDGQEGRQLHLYFCPSCGSTVYWENPTWRPGYVSIAGGAFASVEGGSFVDPGLPEPKYSVWESRKLHWLTIPAHEHYPRNPLTAMTSKKGVT